MINDLSDSTQLVSTFRDQATPLQKRKAQLYERLWEKAGREPARKVKRGESIGGWELVQCPSCSHYIDRAENQVRCEMCGYDFTAEHMAGVSVVG